MEYNYRMVSIIVMNKGKTLFVLQSGSTFGSGTLNNFKLSGCSRIMDTAVNADLSIGSGVVVSPLSESIYSTAGTATIRGAGCYIDTSVRDAAAVTSGAIRMMNIDYPVDTAKLASPVAGDKCYNTNAASPPLKTGPSIYNGTAWKSLLDIP